ncbi:MAG TPA: class I SAM-dependent methyltransferase [Pirellulales bacterium]|nr:class I SAM-dependent methyltransferase [Pirellulales bacterium]
MAACLSYQASIARLDTAALPRPWLNAPFVRTPNAIVDAMLELAAPRESDLLYDLGCGDGRIVVRAAKKYGCRAVGFDLAPERVEEAREIARLQGLEDRVTIVEQDIFTLDLAEADIVTLYLLPRLNQRLIPQLKRLRPGTRVVSHEFDLPGIVPERAVSITPADDQREHTLYLWIAPLREKSP